MEKPLPAVLGLEMKVVKAPSLQSLQEHPGVWWKPLGEVGMLGTEKGLLVKMEDREGSFLCAENIESLRNMTEKSGQLLIMG